MTKASKVSPSIEPSKFIDAIIPLRALAPIIDTFLPRLCGRVPLALCPFSARAYSLIKARLTPASSRKTKSLTGTSRIFDQKSTLNL